MCISTTELFILHIPSAINITLRRALRYALSPLVDYDVDRNLLSKNRRHHSNRKKLSPVTAYPSRAAEIYTRGVIQRRIQRPRGEEPSAPESVGTLQAASRVAPRRVSAPPETKHIVRI